MPKVIKNITKSQFEKKLKEIVGRFSTIKEKEHVMTSYIYTAIARRDTPILKIDAYSPYWKNKRKAKRVHIGTYAPLFKRGYIFLENLKYVKNRPKRKEVIR